MINFNNNQKRKQLLFEYLKRLKQKKNELKKIIIQTTYKNKNQKTKKKLALSNLLSIKHTVSYNLQQNRCLFTGRIKGFQKNIWTSRQTLKKFLVLGDIQNLKKKSW